MNTQTILRQGPVNATRVLAHRPETHNDDWTRADKAYYDRRWDTGGKSLFKLPTLGLDKGRSTLVRYQSKGNRVERVS